MPVTKNNKVVLGMSGGLDSSMCAHLLKQQGYEVHGVTIRTWDSISSGCWEKEKGCCTIDALFEAKNLAQKLNIPHYIIDSREEFKSIVVQNFIDEYKNGRTPNPCVVCNPNIKWKYLVEKANELGCYHIATGHYAGIGEHNGRYFIKTGSDMSKDQSYFLWDLPQEYLKRTIFPLHNINKTDIRQMAQELGNNKLASKRESQENCFIPEGDYRDFLKAQSDFFTENIKPGNFVDSSGKILGKHKGYPFYTIGQRKGLEIALGERVFVTKIIPETNTIVLGTRNDLESTQVEVSNVQWQKYNGITDDIELTTKIRYRNQAYKSTLVLQDNKIIVNFTDAVSSVTPGQSAVFYEGTDVIGGGIIEQ